MRFTDNIVDGDSAVELIRGFMAGYVVAASNVLRNASGPLLGDLCATP